MIKRETGFTLLELLIVIMIISILAMVLIPLTLTTRQRAYDVAALSCGNAVMKALRIYQIDNPTLISTPSIGDLYGTAEKEIYYGTGSCGSMPSGSVLQGVATVDGNYEFRIKHVQGKNLYIITRQGIDTLNS